MKGFEKPVPGRSRIRSDTLKSFIGDLEGELLRVGPHRWVRFILQAIVHFVVWLERTARVDDKLDESTLAAFQRHRWQCRCPDTSDNRSPRVLSCLRRFLHYLRERGHLPRWTEPGPVRPFIVQRFLQWMKVHRGVVDKTLSRYGDLVADLVAALGDVPEAYCARDLRAFVQERCRNYSPKTALMVFTAVRMFLRYLASEGMCRPGLEAAFPPVASWSMQSLPQGLSTHDVERVLAGCPRNSSKGLRDKAVLLLLVRLALRAGDVGNLRFSDLSFETATIRVSGKGRREALLPLPQEVGDALLAYLKDGRPRTHSEFVFLRSIAPYRPLGEKDSGAAVSGIAQTALRRAGVVSPRRGSHALRHTAACEMLRQGAGLENIAAILRHRSIGTTGIYAKVDLQLLHEVAQPWPEVL
jgi:integrase/recombinase XerD